MITHKTGFPLDTSLEYFWADSLPKFYRFLSGLALPDNLHSICIETDGWATMTLKEARTSAPIRLGRFPYLNLRQTLSREEILEGLKEFAENKQAPVYDPGLQPKKRVSTTGKGLDGEKVDHPIHYNLHPSGVECIDVIEHMSFNIGNAIKYVWRADHKADAEEDIRKAVWYLERELERRKKLSYY